MDLFQAYVPCSIVILFIQRLSGKNVPLEMKKKPDQLRAWNRKLLLSSRLIAEQHAHVISRTHTHKRTVNLDTISAGPMNWMPTDHAVRLPSSIERTHTNTQLIQLFPIAPNSAAEACNEWERSLKWHYIRAECVCVAQSIYYIYIYHQYHKWYDTVSLRLFVHAQSLIGRQGNSNTYIY